MTAVLASGYGVMFTVLDDFRDDYGIAAQWLGVIVGVGFLASFIAQVFLAPIADRGHARKLVLAGLALNIVGLLGLAAGETLTILLIARFISGIGIGMAVPAVRRIVINADPEHLGNNVGLLLASDVSGFALGPAISALLVPTFGIPAPFLVICVATALCFPIILRVEIVEGVMGAYPPRRFAFDLLGSRPMVAALMMGSCVFLMIGTFDAMWAIVLDDLDAGEWIANIGITIFALPIIFLGSYGGRLAQRVGPFRLGPLGLTLGAVFIFLYGLMPSGILMLAVGLVHAMSDGFTVSSAGVAVGMTAPPDRQASSQGMLGAAETLTGGISAPLAGFLYAAGGRTLAYSVAAALMVGLATASYYLAGPDYRSRRGRVTGELLPDPVSAVTGHA